MEHELSLHKDLSWNVYRGDILGELSFQEEQILGDIIHDKLPVNEVRDLFHLAQSFIMPSWVTNHNNDSYTIPKIEFVLGEWFREDECS